MAAMVCVVVAMTVMLMVTNRVAEFTDSVINTRVCSSLETTMSFVLHGRSLLLGLMVICI